MINYSFIPWGSMSTSSSPWVKPSKLRTNSKLWLRIVGSVVALQCLYELDAGLEGLGRTLNWEELLTLGGRETT